MNLRVGSGSLAIRNPALIGRLQRRPLGGPATSLIELSISFHYSYIGRRSRVCRRLRKRRLDVCLLPRGCHFSAKTVSRSTVLKGEETLLFFELSSISN